MLRTIALPAALLACASACAGADKFFRGDLVKLARAEPLLYEGKPLLHAAKGQEFPVLRHDAIRHVVLVEYLKDDGALVAAALPEDALDATTPPAWDDLLRGVEAFRDLRLEDAKRLLARAALDKERQTLAAAISARISGAAAAANAARNTPAARQALVNALGTLRDTAQQLAKAGHTSIAAAIDDGADRLAAQVPGTTAPATKLDRADVSKRTATASRASLRSRQLIATKKLNEATKHIDEGLAAEPGRPDLAAMKARIERDLAEAQSRYDAAQSMRTRGQKGAIHAITALEQGLKICVDHPKLRELKKEMHETVEERTAPPLTPAFLSAAGSDKPRAALENGRALYTLRCTECHDLELLDSRSLSGWQRTVSGMAGRANLSGAQQASILEYLGAALKYVEKNPAD